MINFSRSSLMNKLLGLIGLCVMPVHAKIYNYTNSADNFSPTVAHKQAHMISGKDFERNEEYIEAVLTLPIVLCGLGFISLIVWDIIICACSPKKAVKEGHQAAWILYYGISIGIVVLGLFVYMGYADLDDGLGRIEGAISTVQDRFDLVAMGGDDLRADYETMHTNCLNSDCCKMTTIQQNLNNFDRYLGYLEDDSLGVIDNADDVVEYMDEYSDFGLLFTLLISFFLIISMIFYLLFAFIKSNGGMTCASCCGNITFIVVMIIGAIFVIMTATVADICYEDPTYTIINQVPPGKGQVYLTWYATCGETGSNPLFDYSDRLTMELNALLNTIASMQTCATEPEFQKIKEAASDSLVTIDKVVEVAACEDVQAAWFDAVNDGVCGTFFSGLRICWIIALLATLLIFILQVPSSIVRNACSANATIHPKDEPTPVPQGDQQEVMMIQADKKANNALV